MAKRKRLTPMALGPDPVAASPRPAVPPIAQVGADAAAQAAFEELQREVSDARETGRFIQELPLEVIDKTHLVRDRLHIDEDEMEVLMASLSARGQQTPIEVLDLGGGHYGLISGWRRMTALARLGHTTVQAVIRMPSSASDAYIAMVEENEIRVGLSYFERAAIVQAALDQGIFTDRFAALQALFGSASKAKRSKIGGFLPLVAALGDALLFPTALTERVGLPLARALEEDATLAPRLRAALKDTPPETPTEEERLLRTTWQPPKEPAPEPSRQELRPGVFLEVSGGFTKPILHISGPAVDPRFCERLENWLKGEG